ncbi:MAG: hypothetical protein RMJ33_04690 [Saprospiraceae bacterium]|nr:gliding motility-associated C-terminal domain-containing protein [Saprospiraceae bacterium]MDW8229116.1 hypothetical protein [Saprospiraceae bacterium]
MKKRTLLCFYCLMGLLALGAQAQITVVAVPTPPSCAGRADGAWALTLQQGAVPVVFSWRNLTLDVQGAGVLTQVGLPFLLTQLRAGSYRFDFVSADGATYRLEATLSEPAPLQGRFFVFDPPNPCAYLGWGIGFFQVNGGTPPYAYLWSNGHTLARMDSITSGRWTVMATDVNGCRVEADTVLRLPEPLRADIRVFGESCAGRRDGRLRLEAASGGLPPYLCSLNGAPLGARTAWDSLPPGLHLLRIEDAAGCSLSVGALIPAGLSFLLDIGADTTIFQGDTLYRSVASSLPLKTLRWQPTLGVLISAPGQIALSPYFTTTYRLTAVSEEGCEATTTLRVEVRRQRNVYAPNAFWPEASTPENRAFTLYAETGVEQITLLQIFDRQGQLCFENRNFAPNTPAAGWDGIVRGQRAAGGVYTWRAAVRYTNGTEERLAGDVTLVR